MAYIYKITNTVNDKVYIGKTVSSIETRWKQHIKDSLKNECKNRPLYRAFNKYGIDVFVIEKVEECDVAILEEREKYWIEFYRSFRKGYNATLGGDGKPYLDYDIIINVYKQTLSMTETARICQCDRSSVSLILKNHNIETLASSEVNKNKYGKVVNQYDLQGKLVNSFSSVREAARSLGKEGYSHISDVCKGKRKTAYGYKWSFSE